MSELVERLLAGVPTLPGYEPDRGPVFDTDRAARIMRSAAARIEALEAQLAQAREALTGAHAHIDAMQDVIRRYLPPDSDVSEQEALEDLIGLLDGLIPRELFQMISAALAAIDVQTTAISPPEAR